MLRKVNGVMEERGEDGVWRPVNGNSPAPTENLDAEISDLLSSSDIRVTTGLDDQVESQESQPGRKSNGRYKAKNAKVDGSESTVSVDELDIGDVPGLLSDEGPKSTAGSARLQRLRQRAKGRGGSRVVARSKPKVIVVPQSAVEVTGPDAAGSRLQKGPGRRSVPIKEAPALLENRPKWVQDLFEAHFRSELAYGLRHLPSGKNGRNRMKLSRQDYAIGWLVMFDKAREDPGILRAKG